MNKWKCDICKKEFDNFHAQGFNNKIYCPLCFFKEENRRLKSVLKEIRELLLNFNNGVCVMDGKEKPAFTKVLNFDETRELLWKILEIIDKAGIGE